LRRRTWRACSPASSSWSSPSRGPSPPPARRSTPNSRATVSAAIPASANRGLRPADGLARSLYSILYGQPLSSLDPTRGKIQWQNLPWDNLAWDNLAWDNLPWDFASID